MRTPNEVLSDYNHLIPSASLVNQDPEFFQ